MSEYEDTHIYDENNSPVSKRTIDDLIAREEAVYDLPKGTYSEIRDSYNNQVRENDGNRNFGMFAMKYLIDNPELIK